MKSRLWIGLVILLFAFGASAASRSAVLKTAEMSMLVTGTVDIEKDGRTGAHRVDQPDKLPPAVLQLIEQGLPRWQFEPVEVDGKVVRARAKMGLRVVAKQKGDGNYELRIGSASFGDEAGVKGETVTSRDRMKPPAYPQAAYMSGVQGTVYLVLKISKQGTVEEAIDEQVNLTVSGNSQQMEQGRKMLSASAKAAARKWTFDPPTHGPYADELFWSVRVPVDFKLCSNASCSRDAATPPYGVWQAYIPGPKNPIPWRTDDNDQGADALVAGTVNQVGSGPKLLTPLSEG